MNPRKKLIILFIISLIVLISGLISDKSVGLGICENYSNCADSLIFAYGEPIINLFSIFVPFLFIFIFFSQKFIKYWFDAILWSMVIPVGITFLTPMYCGGFLGCLFEREWVASRIAVVYVVVMMLVIIITEFVKRRKRKFNR